VSNPPYYPLDNGRINPHQEKAIARHEIKATERMSSGCTLPAADSGSVLIIFPAKRLIQLLYAFKTQALNLDV